MGDLRVDTRATPLDAHATLEPYRGDQTAINVTEMSVRLEHARESPYEPSARERAGVGRRVASVLRRSADLVVAATGLVVLAPLYLVIALVVRLDSRGAPIYGGWRLTKNGRHFRCWKFRTMHADSRTRLERYLVQNVGARHEFERFHKLAHDPRVTRVGRFLRATSLDEIPQLFNVLVGEMSLVGPRPYLVEELVEAPEARVILAVKPGVTGLWQVSGRNELTFRQRLRMESFYSRRRSLGWDAILLARTFAVVAKRRGAR